MTGRGRWTNRLIAFYGTTGIALLAVLGTRQRLMLRQIVAEGSERRELLQRVEELAARIEAMLLQVEQEARATAHVLGADIEFDDEAAG